MAEHSKQECADFLERIVYLLDNELDEAECALVVVRVVHDSPPSRPTVSRSLVRT